MTRLGGTALGMRHAASPNNDARPPGVLVDLLVLHATGTGASDAIDRLRDPASRASTHYVVEQDGLIWQLVPEQRRAWHAGVSSWRGHTALDDRSVGVAIVQPGRQGGGASPALQMAALCELCLDILGRHPIPACNVVGHGDVAPGVVGPAEAVDWRGLAANGVGLWPPLNDGPLAPADDVAAALRAIGYSTVLPEPVVLRAFQRHWRPERVDGLADLATRRQLAAVCHAVSQLQAAP